MPGKWKTAGSENQRPPRTGVALLAAFFKAQMEKTETLPIRSRRKKVCLLEIAVTQFLKRALEGDERAVKDLLVLIKKAEKWRKLRPKRQVFVLNPSDAYV